MLREIEHFILRNIDRKYINPFFLDGRERPAEHRSGQVLFSPHAEFKTKGEGESVRLSIEAVRPFFRPMMSLKQREEKRAGLLLFPKP
ncbi:MULTISPECIES: hypothetical protein [Bacillus]|uniref:hypothetical protein n=1 Tax=Bacillus TaxID=1386 RepID=UPI000376812D|nr:MULTISPECIES: hypothetical protein [Bacillus]